MMKNPARSHTACSFACIFCFHVVYIVAGKHNSRIVGSGVGFYDCKVANHCRGAYV